MWGRLSSLPFALGTMFRWQAGKPTPHIEFGSMMEAEPPGYAFPGGAWERDVEFKGVYSDHRHASMVE